MRSDELHIWLSFSSNLSENILKRYREFLTEDEKSQYHKFLQFKDKMNYLVSRVLMRTVLSSYLGVHPSYLLFSRDPFGKLKVQSEKGPLDHISFNLSHTKGLVVLAVSKSLVGVDAEYLERDLSLVEIARENFSSREFKKLSSLPSGDQQKYFYKLWTLKESYLKARGEGLSLLLSWPSFDIFGNKRLVCRFDKALKDVPSDWQFFLFSPSKVHTSAASILLSSRRPASVKIIKTVPLTGNPEILDLTILSNKH